MRKFILEVFVIAIQKNKFGNPKSLVTNHGRTIKNETVCKKYSIMSMYGKNHYNIVK